MQRFSRAGALAALAALTAACRTAGPSQQGAPGGNADGPAAAGSATAGLLEPRWLVPGTDTMIMTRAGEAQPISTFSSPVRVVVGMTIETVRRARSESGRNVLDVTFEERDGSGTVARTSTRVDAMSLLPMRQRAELGGGHVVTLQYVRGEVVGIDSATGTPARHFSARVPDTAYTSGAIDLLLRSLPLADHFRASVPLYFPAENLTQSLPVRVMGQERITTRAGQPADCWLVAADFPGGITEHFWIDQTSHSIQRILAHESETSLVRYDR
jgi:hypothetical protein